MAAVAPSVVPKFGQVIPNLAPYAVVEYRRAAGAGRSTRGARQFGPRSYDRRSQDPCR
jgi:hypothetical protein